MWYVKMFLEKNIIFKGYCEDISPSTTFLGSNFLLQRFVRLASVFPLPAVRSLRGQCGGNVNPPRRKKNTNQLTNSSTNIALSQGSWFQNKEMHYNVLLMMYVCVYVCVCACV